MDQEPQIVDIKNVQQNQISEKNEKKQFFLTKKIKFDKKKFQNKKQLSKKKPFTKMC